MGGLAESRRFKHKLFSQPCKPKKPKELHLEVTSGQWGSIGGGPQNWKGVCGLLLVHVSSLQRFQS